jgi:eukaryotic-like serine/threonine-protein kinase
MDERERVDPTIEAARQIDRICEAFEQAWLTDSPPRIADYLPAEHEPPLPGLLSELLKIDVQQRKHCGKQPALLEYLNQFPDRESEVLEAYQAAVSSARLPQDSAGSAQAGSGRRILGDFELLEEIGRGGMGIVYRARQLTLNRIVAVKVILHGSFASQRQIQRFRSEAETAAQLTHRNIVPVYAVGQQETCDYYAMEYVPGTSLSAMKRTGPLSSRDAATLVAKLADGIQAAHDAGIIHRDLKPANILVDSSGEPRITDFGLAKNLHADSGLTRTGQTVGTPSYMSPEQARGDKQTATPAVDVYSLGAVLYFLVTARAPFAAATVAETLDQVIHLDPVPPRRLNPAIARDVEVICLKCLQKQPERRYASASELADDLRRFLRDEPIRARREPWLFRGVRLVRRHRAMAAVLTMAALSVLATVAGLTYGLVKADFERELRQTMEREQRITSAIARRAQTLPGRRFGGLEDLAVAASRGTSLQIQNEAITTLTLPDLRVERMCQAEAEWGFAVAPDFQTYAHSDEQGNVCIRNLSDDVLVRQLPGQGAPAWRLKFSPTSRFLAARYAPHQTSGEAERRFCVWDLAHGKQIPGISAKVNGEAWDFSPDERYLAWAESNQAIVVWDLQQGQESRRLDAGAWGGYLAYSPDGRQLALGVSTPPQARIFDLASGAAVRTLPHPGDVRDVAWSADGQRLATASGSRVFVWNLVSGDPPLELTGHRHGAEWVRFSHAGDLLASQGWDGYVRLWDSRSGELCVESHSMPYLLFSRDDQRLAGAKVGSRAGIWTVAAGREFGVLRGHCENVAAFSVAFDPHSDRLASSSFDGVRLWLPATSRDPLVRLTKKRSGYCQFLPAGHGIVATEPFGMACFPCVPEAPVAEPVPDAAKGRLPLPDFAFANAFGLSRDGRLLATLQQHACCVSLLDLHHRQNARTLPQSSNINSVAVSPTGRWIAGGAWLSRDSKIWDSASGDIVKTLATGDAYVFFSPDDRWLVTGSHTEYVFWRSGSWEKCHTVKRSEANQRGPLAFSPDGRMVAVVPTPSAVRLIESSGGTEIATLLPCRRELISWLAFSADARMLAVACEEGNIHVWRLDLIADQLQRWKIVSSTELLGKYYRAPGKPAGVEANRQQRPTTESPGYPPAFSRQPEMVVEWHPDSQAQARQWHQAIIAMNQRIQAEPDEPQRRAERGYTLADQSEWNEASADLAEAIRLGTKSPVVWFHRAVVDLVRRRHDEYAAVCAQMLDRFADTADVGTANLVSWTCALGLDAVKDDDRPLELANLSLSGGETYWSVLRRGALLYRCGRYEEAMSQLRRAGDLSSGDDWPLDKVFLAMVCSRLGDTAQAQRYLSEAESRMDHVTDGIQWVERAQFAILRAEARALLEGVHRNATLK